MIVYIVGMGEYPHSISDGWLLNQGNPHIRATISRSKNTCWAAYVAQANRLRIHTNRTPDRVRPCELERVS